MLRLGIIGYPLHHTLSPVLHQLLMNRLNLSGEYVAYETPPETLAARLEVFRQDKIAGFNVTIPHKVKVLALLDTVSDEARVLQAVNTVVRQPEGLLHGMNTDVAGFLQGIPEAVRATLPETDVLVLGGGGAARAVAAGLLKSGARSLTFRVRNCPASQSLLAVCEDLKALYASSARCEVVAWETVSELSRYGMVVNTTPVGMAKAGVAEPAMPLTDAEIATLRPEAFVYDLIYRPRQTPLLVACEAHGCRVEDGLVMLLHQGVLAFQAWTGEEVSAAMIEEAEQLLGRVDI
jgi:shikimate dehydrogenase